MSFFKVDTLFYGKSDMARNFESLTKDKIFFQCGEFEAS